MKELFSWGDLFDVNSTFLGASRLGADLLHFCSSYRSAALAMVALRCGDRECLESLPDTFRVKSKKRTMTQRVLSLP